MTDFNSSNLHTCPTCRNQFHQPFVCTTCGAQKLYDATVTGQARDIERLRGWQTRVRADFENFQRGLINFGELGASIEAVGSHETTQPERPFAWYRQCTDGDFFSRGDWPPAEPDDTAWLPLYLSPEGRPVQKATPSPRYGVPGAPKCGYGGSYGWCDLEEGHEGKHHIPRENGT